MGAGSRLRQVLAKNGLVEAMAAHSPLSAMLAAEAGFDAIWASGFELSAMYGVPDVSMVSMTQHLDMTRAIAERSGLPVVAEDFARAWRAGYAPAMDEVRRGVTEARDAIAGGR